MNCEQFTQVECYFVQRLQRIIIGRSTIVLTGCGEDPAGVVSMDISAVSRTCVIATSWYYAIYGLTAVQRNFKR